MHVTDGQSNCLQGTKKPSGSVAKIYLGAAIRHYLFKADRQPNEKASFGQLEIVRELTRRLRRDAGFSPWPALVFAVSVFVIGVLLLHRHASRDFTFAAPADKFQVLQRFDAYHYQFRWLHIGADPVVINTVFCPNYEPQLSAGETITWIHYQDLGRCWDILPEGYGYKFERDAHGVPTLSPNCVFNDRDLTECKPNKQEARF